MLGHDQCRYIAMHIPFISRSTLTTSLISSVSSSSSKRLHCSSTRLVSSTGARAVPPIYMHAHMHFVHVHVHACNAYAHAQQRSWSDRELRNINCKPWPAASESSSRDIERSRPIVIAYDHELHVRARCRRPTYRELKGRLTSRKGESGAPLCRPGRKRSPTNTIILQKTSRLWGICTCTTQIASICMQCACSTSISVCLP